MTLRIGILGTGHAAEIHSKALKAVAPDSRRWYASREPGKAAAISERLGGAGHFGSYQQAVESDLDALVMALPPALHREWALRALSAGKHVIVEKPPFMTVAEFDEVAEAARAADRQLLVAENYFYKPLRTELASAIARNELGRIVLIQLNALKRQATSGWRNDTAVAGGGALFEGGIHWVSLLANIGLTPVGIRASFPGEAGETARADGAGERSAIVTIDYAEGAVATLSYSWDLPALINGLRMSRVYGTDGTLRFETNGIYGAMTGRRWRVLLPGVIDLAGYRAMMKDFVSSIDANRPPAYTLTLARRDLQLVEQAYAGTISSHHS